MATGNLQITPDRYFMSGISLNEDNIKNFRNLYRELSKVGCFDGHNIDIASLLNAAQQLGIQADTEDYQGILQECVKYENEENTFLCVNIWIQGPIKQDLMSISHISLSSPKLSKENEPPTNLMEVKCVLIIKRQAKEINEFLQNFLLKTVKKINSNE